MSILLIVGAVLFLVFGTSIFGMFVHFCGRNGNNRENDTERGQPENPTQTEKKPPTAQIISVNRPPTPRPEGLMKKLKSPRPTEFTFKELQKATNNFSDANLLGEGSFGKVYKGTLNGEMVAVKKLKAGSGQRDEEFLREIDFISQVHHRNLVKLIGYCIHGDENRLLVLEFMINNSLRVHLHGEGRPTMEWSRRKKIAIGSAKGLEYLHQHCKPRIIHRDIKADNILLDENFEPKVADFGIAKFFPDSATHVSTFAKGTPGYVDPHYYNNQQLSDKSDVYSFGVVLHELFTGRRHVENAINIVNWAKSKIDQALKTEKYDDLVDDRLKNNYETKEMKRMIICAAACVRQNPKQRPQMSKVVRVLEGNLSTDRI